MEPDAVDCVSCGFNLITRAVVKKKAPPKKKKKRKAKSDDNVGMAWENKINWPLMLGGVVLILISTGMWFAGLVWPWGWVVGVGSLLWGFAGGGDDDGGF